MAVFQQQWPWHCCREAWKHHHYKCYYKRPTNVDSQLQQCDFTSASRPHYLSTITRNEEFGGNCEKKHYTVGHLWTFCLSFNSHTVASDALKSFRVSNVYSIYLFFRWALISGNILKTFLKSFLNNQSLKYCNSTMGAKFSRLKPLWYCWKLRDRSISNPSLTSHSVRKYINASDFPWTKPEALYSSRRV